MSHERRRREEDAQAGPAKPAAAPAPPSSAESVLALQRSAGNQAVAGLMRQEAVPSWVDYAKEGSAAAGAQPMTEQELEQQEELDPYGDPEVDPELHGLEPSEANKVVNSAYDDPERQKQGY